MKISAFPAEPEEVGDKDLEERANDLEGLVDDDEDLEELGENSRSRRCSRTCLSPGGT